MIDSFEVLQIENILKVFAIMFGLIVFFVGFIMYQSVSRVNKVIKTNITAPINFVINLYLLILIISLLIFIFY